MIETMKRRAHGALVTPIENHGHLGTVPGGPEGEEALRDGVDGHPGCQVVAESFAMRQLLGVVRRVAPKDVTVLVRGETGTGKEVIASLLHASSRRSGRRLIRFNCAAIPDELAESALFGHVRGAFTGAVDERRGFFAEAHCGTLILDEVGELPLSVQGTFLRALEDGEIQRVGSDQIDHVDYKPAGASGRITRETRLKGHDGAAQAEADMKSHPRGSPDSTSSGINIRPKSGFETVYRREEAAATK